MPTVTLTARARNAAQMTHVNKFLKSNLRSLKVKVEILGATSRGWVRLNVSGEDETAALRFLEERIGFCPETLELVEKFSVRRGYITSLKQSKDELRLDIGVSSPCAVDAVVPLRSLLAQLVDGRNIALGKLAELYGFCEGYPLALEILSVDDRENRVEAVLADRQLFQHKEWLKSLLDRLMVIGCSAEEVEYVLKRAGLVRDVVGIENLGLFEHAVVCKLGTDAVGLIPRIGRNLRTATLAVFSPRKLLAFLGSPELLTF